jgi:hypothetical protein
MPVLTIGPVVTTSPTTDHSTAPVMTATPSTNDGPGLLQPADANVDLRDQSNQQSNVQPDQDSYN